MKLGPVLTYKNLDEAERLVGKSIVASDVQACIENESECIRPVEYRGIIVYGRLTRVDSRYPYPFVCDRISYQFIREFIEDDEKSPVYRPYDLSDFEVRKSLMGRWYRSRLGNETAVRCFYPPQTGTLDWEVNGVSAKDFVNTCTWIDDGTPCGQLVEEDEDV